MEYRRAKFADNVGETVVGDSNCIEDYSVVDAFVGALLEEDWYKHFSVHYNGIEVAAEMDSCNTFLLSMFLCFDAAALG